MGGGGKRYAVSGGVGENRGRNKIREIGEEFKTKPFWFLKTIVFPSVWADFSKPISSIKVWQAYLTN